MRCYNGCPDSELQAILDNNELLKTKLAETIPGARCVYFPMEGKFQVFQGLKMILGFESSYERCIENAISEFAKQL